jgi:hypothetical protein
MVGLLLKLHKQIEVLERRDISRGVMARRLGVAQRTYTEYLLGNIDPLAMRALLRLLMQLSDEAIVEVIRTWQRHDPQLPWAREQEKLNPPLKRGPKSKKVLGLT